MTTAAKKRIDFFGHIDLIPVGALCRLRAAPRRGQEDVVVVRRYPHSPEPLPLPQSLLLLLLLPPVPPLEGGGGAGECEEVVVVASAV